MIKSNIVQKVTTDNRVESYFFKKWLTDNKIEHRHTEGVFEIDSNIDITEGLLYVREKKGFPTYIVPVPKKGDVVFHKGRKDVVIEVSEGISSGEPTHMVRFSSEKETIYNWSFYQHEVAPMKYVGLDKY